MLHYLARYTHRVAISNHRLLNVADGEVTFRWKDYAHGNKQRKMTVHGEEFLRRFLLHVLPKGFIRIRSFGFLAARRRTRFLPLCRATPRTGVAAFSAYRFSGTRLMALPILRWRHETDRELYRSANPIEICRAAELQ